MYFDPILQTRHTQVPRNDDGGHDMIDEYLSIFKYPCRPIGKGSSRFLIDVELQIAETYVLVNCKEVEPYLQRFENLLKQKHPDIADDQILELLDKYFNRWLKELVSTGQVNDEIIRQMSYGPSKHVTYYNGIIVNGYRFHTKEYGQNKATMNSGVCVRGNIYGENELDYYDAGYGLVDVKPKSRLHSNEPFVLASQAQQVYYTMYLQRKGRASEEWWVACKMPTVNAEDEVIFLFDTNSPMEEVDINDIYKPMDIPFVDELIDDNECSENDEMFNMAIRGRGTRRGRGRGRFDPPRPSQLQTSPPQPTLLSLGDIGVTPDFGPLAGGPTMLPLATSVPLADDPTILPFGRGSSRAKVVSNPNLATSVPPAGGPTILPLGRGSSRAKVVSNP
ncbi:hypothetical protein SESBI_22193 [Sesbania bispinosa]|nr:hypothetical protein SESBI_22193 [Sesbania bispinosa]